jgi:hypothetical protein
MGDGTTIGCSLGSATFVPVETPAHPERPAVGDKAQRRYFRTPIQHTGAEDVIKVIKELRIAFVQLARAVRQGKALLPEPVVDKDVLRAHFDKDICPLLEFFLDGKAGGGGWHSVLAPWVEQLCHDQSATTVLPLKALPVLERFWRAWTEDEQVAQSAAICDLSSYSVELRNILASLKRFARDGPEVAAVRSACQFLVGRCSDIATQSLAYERAQSQEGSSNPPVDGRFYAFSPSGLIQRDVRSYAIDQKGRGAAKHSQYAHGKEVLDDTSSCGSCSKGPDERSSQITYLFAWFCAEHGHCYGGHLLTHEGRKDAVMSLLAYCPEPPEEVGYDFACGCEEFALNREPGFFLATRFFHDVVY